MTFGITTLSMTTKVATLKSQIVRRAVYINTALISLFISFILKLSRITLVNYSVSFSVKMLIVT